jgi:hypothetical protein
MMSTNRTQIRNNFRIVEGAPGMSKHGMKSGGSSAIIAVGLSLCSMNDGKLSFEEEVEVLHVGTPSPDPTIAFRLTILARKQILSCLKGNSGMILQTPRAVANQPTVEPNKRYPSVRDVGNIIINGNTVTRRKIPVSMRQDTGVIIEKGSGQYNHWEVLTLALRHRNVRRLDTLTSQGFHLHLRRDSM